MLDLKIGVTKNPRFEPLIDGTVKSDRIAPQFTVTTPPELFYRNLKNDEFDVFEMSLSDYLMTRERAPRERWQWCALPIFPAKAFLWLGLYVNRGSGIRGLQDLRGKRVGVPDYVMTAALWMRIFLRVLYNIQPGEIAWYVGRTPALSHGGLLGVDLAPPPGVTLTWLTREQSFDAMLDRGEIDMAFGFAPRHDPKLMTLNIDRYGGTPLESNPRLGKLFSDGGRAVIQAFFDRTGVVPANHVIVIQRRLLEEHAWLASELIKLFSESKQCAYDRQARQGAAYLYFEGSDPASQAAIFGDDPFPFGVEKNRRMLELLFHSSHQEGLTKQLARIEDVFFPATPDT
jgi:4,5-dihydroxyphthalate decarboxylase